MPKYQLWASTEFLGGFGNASYDGLRALGHEGFC